MSITVFAKNEIKIFSFSSLCTFELESEYPNAIFYKNRSIFRSGRMQRTLVALPAKELNGETVIDFSELSEEEIIENYIKGMSLSIRNSVIDSYSNCQRSSNGYVCKKRSYFVKNDIDTKIKSSVLLALDLDDQVSLTNQTDKLRALLFNNDSNISITPIYFPIIRTWLKKSENGNLQSRFMKESKMSLSCDISYYSND